MGKRYKVLLIDNTRSLLDACKLVLNGQSRIIDLPAPDAILDQVKALHIDCIFFSPQLSSERDLETVKSLKSCFPKVPVIIASDQYDEEFILSAFRAGADDFLEKPLDPHRIFVEFCRFTGSSANGDSRFTLYRSGNPESIGPTSRETDSQFARLAAKPLKLISGVSEVFRKELAALRKEATSRDLFDFGLSQRREVASARAGRWPNLRTDKTSLPAWRVHFLGPFRVIINNREITTWPSKKGKQVFAYLLYNRKHPQYRDVLMERFWPHSSPDSSRNCLNVAIHSVRNTLHKVDRGRDYILFKDECYCINPEIDFWFDTEQFLQHWKGATRLEWERKPAEAIAELEKALALYAGDFMQDDPYEEWVATERESINESNLVVLDRLSHYYLMNKNLSGAVELCERILKRDSCREEVHRRLMVCYYRLGDRNKAIKQFLKCSKALLEDLEVGPAPKTLALYEQIKTNGLSEKAYPDRKN